MRELWLTLENWFGECELWQAVAAITVGFSLLCALAYGVLTILSNGYLLG